MLLLIFIFQILLGILICVGLVALIFLITGRYIVHVPFVPVPRVIIPDIIRALDLSPKSILYDLGSGDGRVILSAAKNNPEAYCIGIEKAPLPYFLSLVRQRCSPYRSRIKFRSEDFFKSEIAPATHIFLYLFPKYMDALLLKIIRECRPGTRIVSCDFSFSSISPKEVIELGTGGQAGARKLYIYQL